MATTYAEELKKRQEGGSSLMKSLKSKGLAIGSAAVSLANRGVDRDTAAREQRQATPKRTIAPPVPPIQAEQSSVIGTTPKQSQVIAPPGLIGSATARPQDEQRSIFGVNKPRAQIGRVGSKVFDAMAQSAPNIGRPSGSGEGRGIRPATSGGLGNNAGTRAQQAEQFAARQSGVGSGRYFGPTSTRKGQSPTDWSRDANMPDFSAMAKGFSGSAKDSRVASLKAQYGRERREASDDINKVGKVADAAMAREEVSQAGATERTGMQVESNKRREEASSRATSRRERLASEREGRDVERATAKEERAYEAEGRKSTRAREAEARKSTRARAREGRDLTATKSAARTKAQAKSQETRDKRYDERIVKYGTAEAFQKAEPKVYQQVTTVPLGERVVNETERSIKGEKYVWNGTGWNKKKPE